MRRPVNRATLIDGTLACMDCDAHWGFTGKLLTEWALAELDKHRTEVHGEAGVGGSPDERKEDVC